MAASDVPLKRGRSPRFLIMTPTRELARQVNEELGAIAKPFGLTCAAFYGGVSYLPQENAISKGLDILVATPGRLTDHLERGLNIGSVNKEIHVWMTWSSHGLMTVR